VRLDGQRMSQRCVLCSAAAIASCLRRNFAGLWCAEHLRLAHPSPCSNRSRPPARACLRAASRSTRAWQPGVAHAMVSACAVVSPARVASVRLFWLRVPRPCSAGAVRRPAHRCARIMQPQGLPFQKWLTHC
jgi:hypothetical protein